MKRRAEGFRAVDYLAFSAAKLLTLAVCVSVGSVSVPIGDTLRLLASAVSGASAPSVAVSPAVILSVRLPRVLCVALTGASLSLCGCAMQGLLRNPLADGSTLGVSSGASLGAVVAIAFGFTLPAAPFAGTMLAAMLFAFLSIVAILALAYRLDRTLATNTIILIGVIFSMFASSLMSVVITFASDKVKQITFWTMGSLSGSSYENALALAVALVLFGGALLMHASELNAFAIGEDNARHVGVNVRRVKLLTLVAVSGLIGVCVSIGGSIGFVGLVTPHILRMLVGPNHKRLLPASMFGGAIFLMLCDLAARTLLSPRELPIGFITSLIGAALFVYIFDRSRRKGRA